MILQVARKITGKTQLELSRHVGISQTLISLYESGEADYIHYEQKKMIENVLGLKVNWRMTPEREPLTREEIRDMRWMYQTLSANAPAEKVNTWLSGFKTSREAFVEAKRVIDTNVVAIPMLEMKWKSDGTPDFSELD